MTSLRFVVFDAYGTLLDVHAAVARHAPRLGAAAAGVSALWRQKQLEYSWILSQAGAWEPFWSLTDRALGHALAVYGVEDASLRADLLAAYHVLDAYPEAVPVLSAPRAAGHVTAILSNGSPDMLAAATASAGLAPLLDDVLTVDPLRVYKPSPRVYALMTERFGCQPHEIAFVSANAWDAYGAARFGCRVYWLDRGGTAVEYWLDTLALRIAALSDLTPALA
jgi:2-haloacid dehalogenase